MDSLDVNKLCGRKRACLDSNQGPSVPETDALST